MQRWSVHRQLRPASATLPTRSRRVVVGAGYRGARPHPQSTEKQMQRPGGRCSNSTVSPADSKRATVSNTQGWETHTWYFTAFPAPSTPSTVTTTAAAASVKPYTRAPCDPVERCSTASDEKPAEKDSAPDVVTRAPSSTCTTSSRRMLLDTMCVFACRGAATGAPRRPAAGFVRGRTRACNNSEFDACVRRAIRPQAPESSVPRLEGSMLFVHACLYS